MYVRNMDRTFNKKGLIENTMEVNIYYQRHRKMTEIDWKTGEVKITRCSKEYKK